MQNGANENLKELCDLHIMMIIPDHSLVPQWVAVQIIVADGWIEFHGAKLTCINGSNHDMVEWFHNSSAMESSQIFISFRLGSESRTTLEVWKPVLDVVNNKLRNLHARHRKYFKLYLCSWLESEKMISLKNACDKLICCRVYTISQLSFSPFRLFSPEFDLNHGD